MPPRRGARSARDPAALEDAESVGRIAAERTLAKLGAQKLPTTTLPVWFESRVAGSLFGHLVGAGSGSAYAVIASGTDATIAASAADAPIALLVRVFTVGSSARRCR